MNHSLILDPDNPKHATRISFNPCLLHSSGRWYWGLPRSIYDSNSETDLTGVVKKTKTKRAISTPSPFPLLNSETIQLGPHRGQPKADLTGATIINLYGTNLFLVFQSTIINHQSTIQRLGSQKTRMNLGTFCSMRHVGTACPSLYAMRYAARSAFDTDSR